MIFESNTTSVGTLNIPMAEGYDSGVGCALALVEAARNDMIMFQAMLNVDAKEIGIKNESAGYVQEAEIIALQEATLSSIWAKIKELFSKLLAKVKGIFHTFMSKINSLFMSDKKMVNKYEKEIRKKGNLGHMEVKWSDVKHEPLDEANMKDADAFKALADTIFNKAFETNDTKIKYDKERSTTNTQSEMLKKVFAGTNINDADSLDEDYDEHFFEEQEKKELDDCKIDGEKVSISRHICEYLKESKIKKIGSRQNKLEKVLSDLVKDADKEYKKAIDRSHAKKGEGYRSHTLPNGDINKYTSEVDKDESEIDYKERKTGLDADVNNASGAYDLAVAYQTIMLRVIGCWIRAVKKDYAQRKAVFMKAIAANDKKLEESTIYADAIAEAAEDEVEDVISGALSKEELSKICNASKNVKDGDVSDDPSELTYGPDSYYDNRSYVRTDGSIDTEINSKSESALFAAPLY